MELLTNEKQELHQNTKLCHIFKENFEDKYANEKCIKVRDHCYYAGEYRCATHSICNLKYTIPKEITMMFRNGLNYDSIILSFFYHSIKKQLEKVFKGQFLCLGGNTEKCITF